MAISMETKLFNPNHSTAEFEKMQSVNQKSFEQNNAQSINDRNDERSINGQNDGQNDSQNGLLAEHHKNQCRIELEKPENGLKGLRHWREDMVAGLIVSLVSVPLSLGIAVASGAPPIAGLISSIIAGLVFPLLGGAYMTISGPAAGLAPVVLATIVALGHGNMEIGYKLCLAAICLAGVVQVLLSMLKAARLSSIFPSAAIEGMLASIGLLIIAKQIPNFIGHKFQAHEFFGIVSELPAQILVMNPKVLAISAVCLFILVGLSQFKSPNLKIIPPQLIVVFVGIAMGNVIGLDSNLLIHIPDKVLSGITFPDFNGLLANQALWVSVIGCVLTLTLVDGCESLATIKAIDKIDPYHRNSNPDRTLLAMGVSNVCSSMVGGLTIIPGGIKSTTCILSGGKTLWANFYNAIFLLIYLFLAKDLINMIPLGVLAAILIHIGYKLCGPKRWARMSAIGWEQSVVFASTVFVTLATDLLWGLLFGTALKFMLTLVFYVRNDLCVRAGYRKPTSIGALFRLIVNNAKRMVANPVVWRKTDENEGIHVIYVNGPVVCFNSMAMNRELESIPNNIQKVQFFFGPGVALIDHTSVTNLLAFSTTMKLRRKVDVELLGFDLMCRCSKDDACMRVANPLIQSRPVSAAA